jgi:hypothetical protein
MEPGGGRAFQRRKAAIIAIIRRAGCFLFREPNSSPHMNRTFNHALLALTAIGMFTSTASATKSGCREKGHATIAFDLQPSVGAPAGPSGSAEIDVREFKSAQTAALSMTTAGLAAGSYSLDAVLKDETTMHLGDFSVDVAAGADPSTASADATVMVAIPIDAFDIATLSVSDATLAMVLEGEAEVNMIEWKYFANVRVTGPDVIATSDSTGGPKPKHVHGHALSKSFFKNNVEGKRQFLWVSHGAPKDTELTVNVDGEAVGTVTSSPSGKVMFEGLVDEVVLRAVKLVTLTDALGAVVMQAQF